MYRRSYLLWSPVTEVVVFSLEEVALQVQLAQRRQRPNLLGQVADDIRRQV